jgi:hypothetical protein
MSKSRPSAPPAAFGYGQQLSEDVIVMLDVRDE